MKFLKQKEVKQSIVQAILEDLYAEAGDEPVTIESNYNSFEEAASITANNLKTLVKRENEGKNN